MEKIKAPKIPSSDLWAKTPEEFNKWRRENDYPRIIEFLKNEISYFTKWYALFDIKDSELLEFGPSIFLRDDELFYIYELSDDKGITSKEIRKTKHNVKDIIRYEKTVNKRKEILPFFKWIKEEDIKDDEPNISITLRTRLYDYSTEVYINNKLELLNANSTVLPQNYILTGRQLEFLNIDNLEINHASNNNTLKIWYSSAINMTVNGSLSFINIYQTPLYSISNTSLSCLKLNNGTFQDWSINNRDMKLHAKNSVIYQWIVNLKSIDIIFENTDIKESEFSEQEIKFNHEYQSASLFHKRMKRVYSSLSQVSEAGKHFFKEKAFEQKSTLYPKYIFKRELSGKGKFDISMIYLKSYRRYFNLTFQNLLWGFGEKPIRVFGLAFLVILLFSSLYYFSISSETYEDIANSIYYSIVTFSTLGYGDISQKTTFLKLSSAVESLVGLSLMAIAIAGFATKTKDY
ncbi:potassium channel family protein [Poseidonibacter lekithochrous]|uniref:potassium channel family protein n=1 Tax=Poseidonibacter lekithochrous TaxID=1904463 RepID=UPI000D337112|nr:potassium channel family protein [Poseidonibacter lekithochrous]